MLRLLAAALFVVAGTIGVVLLAGALFDGSPGVFGPAVGLPAALAMLALSIFATALFNRSGLAYLTGRDPDALMREWEAQGLLESTDYKAIRAFELEEWEDEGMHFFLELEDGSVLYLNGQYLYEYEEIVDDVEVPIPRRFPCTDFTVKRHRKNGFVVDIDCRGTAFEPEAIAPPFGTDDYKRGVIPEDGEVITGRTYDEIKRERLARRG